MERPEELVARQFMSHKGYGEVLPYDVEKLDGQPCWYFLYRLPEGILELEVSWDSNTGQWDTYVSTFTLAG